MHLGLRGQVTPQQQIRETLVGIAYDLHTRRERVFPLPPHWQPQAFLAAGLLRLASRQDHLPRSPETERERRRETLQ